MATQAWKDAAQVAATLAQTSASYAPIVLANFSDLTRIFGTAAVSPLDVELLMAPVELGGLGEVTWALDEMTTTARLGGASLALINGDNLARTLVGGGFRNTTVKLSLGFEGLANADFEPLFTGKVDRYGISYDMLAVSLVDRSLSDTRNLSTLLGIQYFPGAPAENRGTPIPMLVGGIINGPTIQVAGAALGHLAIACTNTDTTISLREYNASFPASGTFTLEAETGITYSGRQLINVYGQTYLQLTGLVRGAPVAHAIDATVTLTNVSYVYLIGYQIATTFSLNAVRNNGVIVAPGGYTLSVGQADYPVSLLTFTSQQGLVTVDIIPAGVANLLTNGGFETGSASSWTTANGGTAAVTTTAPKPTELVYRAGLTGRLSLYGDLYQEITTAIGSTYAYSIWYQNTRLNSATNGGFELGTMANWTIQTETNATVAAQHFTLASVAGQEGDYLCVVAGDGSGKGARVVFYRDFPTTIGTRYTLSFLYATYRISVIMGPILFTIAGEGLGQRIDHYYSEIILRIGSPLAFVSRHFVPTSHVGTSLFVLDAPMALWEETFAATSETTRVEFDISVSNNTSFALQISQKWFGYLDDVNLIVEGTKDESSSALMLGTPTNYSLYANAALPRRFGWAKKADTFIATTTTTRLTLQSQYNNTSLATYFDDVRITRLFSGLGGVNPIDAMLYVLTTFMPDVAYDTASFTAAYTALAAWQFGSLNEDPGDGYVLLNRMASQCKSLLTEDPSGVLSLTVLDESRAIAATFDTTNIVRTDGGSTFHLDAAPLDTLYTSIYVYFGAQTGGSTSPDAFSGVTYATPTETTSTNAALAGYCDAALDIYGRDHRLDVFAEWIQDFQTANLLLEWLVLRHTVQYDFCTFSTWLDAIPLRVGQVVQITHPRLPGGKASFTGEIIGHTISPQTMTVDLTVRLLAPAATGSLVWAPSELVPPTIEYLHPVASLP